MSLKKSATRRLSLLAGASMIAASLTAFGGVALTPTAAHAYDECVPGNATTQTNGPGGTQDVTLNGTLADTFDCTGPIPSISYPSTSGALTLELESNLTVTGGILVTPNGTNAVSVIRPQGRNENNNVSGDPQVSNSAGAAINIDRTVNASTGGNITVTLIDGEDNFQDDPMNVTGTTAAIRARNTGTGNTSITLGTGNDDFETMAITATAGAALDLSTTGTGPITVTTSAVLSGTTSAITVGSGGNVTINQGNFGFARGQILGTVALNNTGNTAFNNYGTWKFEGVSTLHNMATATGTATLSNNNLILTTGASATVNFGIATGVLNNAGNLAVGAAPGASTLTFSGLDTWNNTGNVFFGWGELLQTDGETNDRIVVTNTTPTSFTGSGASLLVVDVDFTASQASCAAAVTADCLDLRGHNTAGTTGILVNPSAIGFTAERIVLVDVAGAGTDAGVFHVSDQSPGYRPFGDGMVDTGLFLYEVTHDTAAKQHVLTVAAVDEEAVEFNLAARSALPAWDTATGSWFDRQADLRNTLRGLGGGLSPGAWLRVIGAYANETKVSYLEIGGDSVDVLTSNTQDTLALVGGLDLVGAVGDGGGWVAGVTFGKITSEVGFKENPNGFEFDGHSLGAYASYATPSFFVDAIVNTTTLDATYTGASLGLSLEGEAQSTGYRIDGGWRFDWGDGIWFEPLAALSYVTTDLGDMPVATGVAAEFDEMTNLRGSLGARLSGDVEFDGFSLQLAGTGRVWQEFDGESASAVTTGFGDFAFTDQAEETFGEVGVSLALFGMGGRLSAQLGTGVEFREGYQSVDVTLGGRYQW